MIQLTYANPHTGEKESSFATLDVSHFGGVLSLTEVKPQIRSCWRYHKDASARPVRRQVDLYPSMFFEDRFTLEAEYDEIDEILARVNVLSKDPDAPHSSELAEAANGYAKERNSEESPRSSSAVELFDSS